MYFKSIKTIDIQLARLLSGTQPSSSLDKSKTAEQTGFVAVPMKFGGRHRKWAGRLIHLEASISVTH